ncbi:MAG TPA: hypothetical protein VM580_06480 [Labilithrix sp.]|jgi:hypothetical protein|nr:hypothetical protein [Labilithrix sp.]
MADPSSKASKALERRIVEVAGHHVGVTTYMVAARWSCRVDNIDPGTIIARANGATREEAEETALANASVTLGMRDAAAALRRSVEDLRKRSGEGNK